MAKSSKKSAPKKAKKSAPKAKSVSKAKPAKAKAVKAKVVAKAKPVKVKAVAKTKPVKKAAPAKPVAKVKKAEAKAVVKAVAKPMVSKIAAAPKPPKAAKAAKVEEVLELKKAVVAPNMNMQLNIFPIISQRPIAHKPAKVVAVNEDKTRYSPEELKEFEALIMKKMNKAKDELKVLKEALNRTNDEGTDSTSGGNTKVLEDGAETAEKENLSQLAARQLKYITNLENALVRIKNGTYGICSVTGKLISKERLYAVPHTTQSIEAKMMKKD
jgi:RNA polymerase-binding transcription factor DksA